MVPLHDSNLTELQGWLGEGPVELPRGQVVQLVLTWIRWKTPAAVVRFGEGEARLLVANDARSVEVARRKLLRQTGGDFTAKEVLQIRSMVMHAFDEADVVGIRGNPSFNEERKMWVHRIECLFEDRCASGRRPAIVTRSRICENLHRALATLLDGVRMVSVISCRDLKSRIELLYGVEDVRLYQTPSEYIKREIDDEYEAALHGVPIWPEFYHRLRSEISVRVPGEVFLVGAGILGKDLCIRIRELGGIALDMGSCLDLMAGKVTRGPNLLRLDPSSAAPPPN